MADHNGNPDGCCPECGAALNKEAIVFAVEYYYACTALISPSDLPLCECERCGKPLQVTLLVHGRGER